MALRGCRMFGMAEMNVEKKREREREKRSGIFLKIYCTENQ